MKLGELMAGHTPDANFEGFLVNDNFVLAIDCSTTGNAASVDDYSVVQVGTNGLDPKLNATTQDKQYIRAGLSTTKTGTQRSFKVSGDRYIGDDFQDFVFSHKITYGRGQEVCRKYAYFNLLTGKGELGMASIIVNSDGSGEAGNSAEIDIDIKTIGDLPTEYTYTTGSGE